MLENYRIYKSNIYKGFKSLIVTLSQQDNILLEITDQLFANKIGKTFNSPNFFYCFYFIKNYLNVKGSTPLDKQYLKTIYVNLTIRIRQQYLKPQNKKADNWIKVLNFFNKVALLPAYDDVDLYDFQQLTSTFRTKKESKKRDFVATQQSYISIALLLKKDAPLVLSNVRTSKDANAIDDDDNDDDKLRQDSSNNQYTSNKRRSGNRPSNQRRSNQRRSDQRRSDAQRKSQYNDLNDRYTTLRYGDTGDLYYG